MIILITGASHTGKTLLSQKLLEKYQYPYLSIDHLKMGLIRSGHTNLTPYSSDEELTDYLWPIVLEIIKTAMENNQNLIIEGCYIPLDYKKYFKKDDLINIKFYCLIMSESYITNKFNDIKKYSSVIENRKYDDIMLEDLIKDNNKYLKLAKENNLEYIYIDKEYFDIKN